jgi:GTP diphosphokinase / guanosine-3',5'-bis(diphosphate) 3'-diphosphatase
MPAGGTPLDFAYSVHTDVGNHCVGAKVNGRIVPLDAQLNNGDICEILVNKTSGRPSLDWLSIVKTSSAKHKIKQWFRKERREENVLAGQEALEHELPRAGVRVDTARGELIERIATRLNYATPADLYAAIGFGDASPQAVANRLRDELRSSNVVDLTKIGRKPAVRKGGRKSSGVRIAGVDDVLVRLSKCCSPVPGDPIIGYVTIGRGVSVHRADCPNVAYMNATPERMLQAQWITNADLTHAVEIEVEADDRSQLLQDIMAVFAELKTQVSSVTARVRRDGLAVTSLTIQIRDLDHLHKIITKLEALKNVRRVYRVTKRERLAP